MKNVTLAIDDQLLQASREYAQKQGTTLNALIRQLLERTVVSQPTMTLVELFSFMDRHPIRIEGPWKREDLYDL